MPASLAQSFLDAAPRSSPNAQWPFAPRVSGPVVLPPGPASTLPQPVPTIPEAQAMKMQADQDLMQQQANAARIQEIRNLRTDTPESTFNVDSFSTGGNGSRALEFASAQTTSTPPAIVADRPGSVMVAPPPPQAPPGPNGWQTLLGIKPGGNWGDTLLDVLKGPMSRMAGGAIRGAYSGMVGPGGDYFRRMQTNMLDWQKRKEMAQQQAQQMGALEKMRYELEMQQRQTPTAFEAAEIAARNKQLEQEAPVKKAQAGEYESLQDLHKTQKKQIEDSAEIRKALLQARIDKLKQSSQQSAKEMTLAQLQSAMRGMLPFISKNSMEYIDPEQDSDLFQQVKGRYDELRQELFNRTQHGGTANPVSGQAGKRTFNPGFTQDEIDAELARRGVQVQ